MPWLPRFLVETAQYSYTQGLMTWKWKLPNAANVNEIIEDLDRSQKVWCSGAHSFTAVLQSSLQHNNALR